MIGVSLKDLTEAKDFEVKLQDEFKLLNEEDKNYLSGCLRINEEMGLKALELHEMFLKYQIFSMKYTIKENK